MTTGLDALFHPASVAIVGVSRDPAAFSRRLLGFLRRFGYPGAVVGVNPNLTDVDGMPCFPTLRDVGREVELALVFTPAAHVLDVVRDAAATGARAVIVFSSAAQSFCKNVESFPQRFQANRICTGAGW